MRTYHARMGVNCELAMKCQKLLLLIRKLSKLQSQRPNHTPANYIWWIWWVGHLCHVAGNTVWSHVACEFPRLLQLLYTSYSNFVTFYLSENTELSRHVWA